MADNEADLRTLHGLHPSDAKLFPEKEGGNELNQMAEEEVKRTTEITRWEESLYWFKHVFSAREKRSDPHVPVYYFSGNHDNGYSAFHSARPKELTRFIIITIILGVLSLAIRPVQAVDSPQNLGVVLEFKKGYPSWENDLRVLITSVSGLEHRGQIKTMDVLGPQNNVAVDPPAWIHATVLDGNEWSTFIMRSDNNYVAAYQNSEAVHSLTGNAHLFPGSIDVGFNGSYAGLNGNRANLTNLNLNEHSARDSLRILSQYKHGVSDPFPMKEALTRYVIILGEGQRFTEVDQCIKDGWKSDCYLSRPKVLFVCWGLLSCGVMEDFEPNPAHHTEAWVKNRIKTYNSMLKKLNIQQEDAAKLIRVGLIGTACQHNLKNVYCKGNVASCSTS